MAKRRILIHSEAHYASSGFGTYAKEVLTRLFDTKKYILAEFANYGTVNSPQENCKWQFYANALSNANDPRIAAYNTNPHNQFGMWRFERVLIDFKPDIVFSYLDPWMMNYQELSPYRRFFHSCKMPTCDSAPFFTEWIYTYKECDAIFAYTDWAIKQLKKQGLTNVQCATPPGVDINVFKPVLPHEQQTLKQAFGIPPNTYIISNMMRNQGRKLFPELFKAFKLYLELCNKEGNQDLLQNTILLCHTSYPDHGWEFAEFLKEQGIYNKVFFSYLCVGCKHVFLSTFQDAKALCPHCKRYLATMPSVGHGLDRDNLAKLYQISDVYIQYMKAAGIEMPAIEAASCGLHVMAPYYSGIEDVIDYTEGTPLKIDTYYADFEMKAYRVYPSLIDTAEKLYTFLNRPYAVRAQSGLAARRGVEQHFTWDRTVSLLMNYFDTCKLINLQGCWDAAPNYLPAPAQQPPNNLSNAYDLSIWLLTKVFGKPELLHTYQHATMLQQLQNESQIDEQGTPQYNIGNITNALTQQNQNYNFWEKVRCKEITLPQEDFIEYSNLKPTLYPQE